MVVTLTNSWFCYDIATIYTFDLLINGWYYSTYTLKWITQFWGAGSNKNIANTRTVNETAWFLILVY